MTFRPEAWVHGTRDRMSQLRQRTAGDTGTSGADGALSEESREARPGARTKPNVDRRSRSVDWPVLILMLGMYALQVCHVGCGLLHA